MKRFLVLYLVLLLFLLSTPVQAAKLSGQARDACGSAMANVSVRLEIGGQVYTTTTDTSGNYEIDNISSSSTAGDLTFSRSGYREPVKRRVALVDNTDVTVNSVVIANNVTGALRDGDGRPIKGAIVRLTDSSSAVTETTSGTGGYYEFSAAADDSYTLTAVKSGYSFGSPAITVAGGNVVRNLTGGRTRVSGLVTDGSGNALSNVTVLLLEGSTTRGKTVTDSKGAYQIEAPVSTGTYTVKAVPDAVLSIVNESITINSDGERITQNITCSRLASGDYEEITVTNTNTSGNGSLHQALTDAASKTKPVRIVFNINSGASGDYEISVDNIGGAGLTVTNSSNYPILIDGSSQQSITIKRGSTLALGLPILAAESRYITIRSIEIDISSGPSSANAIVANADADEFRMVDCTISNTNAGATQMLAIAGDNSAVVSSTIQGPLKIIGDDAQIRSNTITYTNGGGIAIGQDSTAERLVVANCTINAITGIKGVNTSGTEFTQSSFIGVLGVNSYGLSMTGAASVDVIGLTASQSATAITGSYEGLAVNNSTISGSSSNSIDINNSNEITINNSTITGSSSNGIVLSLSSNIYVGNNTITNAGLHGLRLNVCSDARLFTNKLIDSTGNGIHIMTLSGDNELVNNRSIRCDNGYYVENASGLTLKANKAFSSKSRGLHVKGTGGLKFLSFNARNSGDDDIKDEAASANCFTNAVADGSSDFAQKPTYSDSYLGTAVWPSIDTVQNPTINDWIVLLNKGVIKARITVAEPGTVFVSAFPDDNETAAVVVAGISFNTAGLSTAQIPVTEDSSLLTSTVKGQLVTDNGFSGASSAIRPSRIGSKVTLGRQKIVGDLQRYVGAGKTDALPFRINNLGSVLDQYTITYTVDGQAADWNIAILLDGVNVTSQAQGGGATTAQLRAQDTASGGGAGGEIRVKLKPGAASSSMRLNLVFTSREDNENVESRTIEYYAAQAVQPPAAAPIYNHATGRTDFYINTDAMSAVSIGGGETKTATIYIYDLSGKVVLQQALSLTSGNNAAELDTSALGVGSYVFQLVIDGNVASRGKFAIAK